MADLNRKEFEVLAALAEKSVPMSQRQLAEETNMSPASVNRALKDLADKGLVFEGGITAAGINALEPYRAKRAVFVAAGFGSRLVPVTLNTMVPVTLSPPKPLVRVNGKRIIDGLLDACLAAGIEEIYIVRGYLAENFDALLSKYPMIKFIDNRLYNDANNISSALCAKDLMRNAYVLEADLLIRNPKIIKKYHYSSDFLAIKKDRSDDWCFSAKDGIITGLSHGGLDCWQEVGISYWSEEDGQKLSKDIEEAFNMPGGRELFFEQVPLKVFNKNYKVEINESGIFSDKVSIDAEITSSLVKLFVSLLTR